MESSKHIVPDSNAQSKQDEDYEMRIIEILVVFKSFAWFRWEFGPFKEFQCAKRYSS